MSEFAPRENFLTEIIDADLAAGKNGGRVVTRFPPEPNGFLHIGHAKSICLNFGLARQYGGRANLRFDDTNPTTEDTRYVESIEADVRWLGFEWAGDTHYASDIFERMYACAVRLIEEGKAYVDSQTVEQIREQRGGFDRPGTEGPHRARSVAENRELFRQMRAGSFPDGTCVLRAKIDMAHPNVLMRDPLLYRVRHAHHHRTLDAWCIYPMYDFAHPLEDAVEGVTHSICTLEFESNRELYDWVLDNTGPWDPRPRQYEFARLSLGYTLMSKRKLLQLVNEGHVAGWDDPRMPTIAGMRRRGVTPEAIRDFADLIGVARNNSVVDVGKLEFAIRQDLERHVQRGMAVLDPLRVVLTDWPADHVEELDLPWWPGAPERAGTRKVPFGRDLFIERDDFTETPPKDWKRLAPGREVRMLGGYVVRCDEVVRGANGAITELRCSHDPSSRGGEPADGRKIGGTLNWVHATLSVPVPVRLYDRLFTVEQPDGDPEGDFRRHLNPSSLVVAENARVEPALAEAKPGTRFQFVRQGYFFTDPVESKPGAPVYNRIIGLKDAWTKPAAKAEEKAAKAPKPVKEARETGPKKGKAEVRAELRAATPALAERFRRYRDELGLPPDEADLMSSDLALAELFDAALLAHPSPRSVARWVQNDLVGALKDRDVRSLPLTGHDFGRFVAMVDDGRLAPAAAKTLLTHLVERGGDPSRLVEELGLGKVDDTTAVEAMIAKMLEEQAAVVARYRAGETKLLGTLMGAAMRATQGAADAALVRKVLGDKLGSET